VYPTPLALSFQSLIFFTIFTLSNSTALHYFLLGVCLQLGYTFLRYQSREATNLQTILVSIRLLHLCDVFYSIQVKSVSQQHILSTDVVKHLSSAFLKVKTVLPITDN